MPARIWIVAPVLAGAAAMVAVHFLLLHTYWDYSEGVYALTAHQMLHGGDLYGHIVGAQPPGVFLAGAALEAIHPGVEWLRFAVGCLQVIAGVIAAVIVLRVTRSRVAATVTAALFVLTPWAVHEHGALTPELVALPFMLGAALSAAGSSARAGAATGILCGLLVLIKLPLAIPAVVIALSGPRRGRAVPLAALTAAGGLGLAWLAGGDGFWRDVFVAQLHSGSRSLGALVGFWAQAGWNVVGLLFCASVAIVLRRHAHDRRLLTVTIALAGANLLTFLSNFKEGTGLNITVPVEAALVPLAVCGAVFAVRELPGRRALAGRGLPRRRVLAGSCALGLAFTVAQSASLIASPHNAIPFERAFSAPAWEIALTGPQYERAVAQARACPSGEAYGGPPLVALDAGRLLPAGQPDEFLPTRSPTLAAVAAQIAAVPRACPLVVSGR